METQLVIFELANETYGVDIASVEGIVKIQPITRMPQAPSFVEGVTNLRGSVLPVIDLRKRFGIDNQEITEHSRIVIVFMDTVKIGMIVDAVSEVLRIPDSSIEPTPPIVTTINQQYIRGIAKLEGRLIILLDLNKVLSNEEQTRLKQPGLS
jgi:purine-binding chemotaxis protein CheW